MLTKSRAFKWDDVFDYSDGVLLWKIKPCKNMEKSSPAGTMRNDGYLQVRFMNKIHLIHRIVWEMFNGEIPDGMQIDHINHERSDNRIQNLRMVTKISNGRNLTKKINNTSGVTGVSWYKSRGKWRVQIMVDRKSIHIGYFSDFESAVAARISANERYGFHKNHGVNC